MLSFKKHLLNNKIQAFSLIEMSLVLAIMGTIAGLSLPMLLEYKGTQKRQHSTKNIDLVLSATGTFAATHQVLPCPASKTSKGEPVLCTSNNMSLANGYVPYKALGLREAASKDGFGNPLRYSINPNLSVHSTFYDNESQAPLKISDKEGKNVLNLENNKDKLAILVLSEGDAFQSPQSSFERENTGESLSFIDAPYSSNKENPFRHIVRWSTRNNLLTYYGKSSPLSQTQNASEHSSGARGRLATTPNRIMNSPRNSVGGDFHDVF